jgi:hypothetical protein
VLLVVVEMEMATSWDQNLLAAKDEEYEQREQTADEIVAPDSENGVMWMLG